MMHPEIELFWNEQNYEIVKFPWRINTEEIVMIYWIKPIGDIALLNAHRVGISKALKSELSYYDSNFNCIEYFFEGKSFSEAEMLSVIKLKAFL